MVRPFVSRRNACAQVCLLPWCSSVALSNCWIHNTTHHQRDSLFPSLIRMRNPWPRPYVNIILCSGQECFDSPNEEVVLVFFVSLLFGLQHCCLWKATKMPQRVIYLSGGLFFFILFFSFSQIPMVAVYTLSDSVNTGVASYIFHFSKKKEDSIRKNEQEKTSYIVYFLNGKKNLF